MQLSLTNNAPCLKKKSLQVNDPSEEWSSTNNLYTSEVNSRKE